MFITARVTLENTAHRSRK